MSASFAAFRMLVTSRAMSVGPGSACIGASISGTSHELPDPKSISIMSMRARGTSLVVQPPA